MKRIHLLTEIKLKFKVISMVNNTLETKEYKSKFISDIYIDNKSIDLTKVCPFDINEEFIKPLKMTQRH